MTQKKRGLGKGLGDLGLSALLGDLKAPLAPLAVTNTPLDFSEEITAGDGQLKKLSPSVIKPGPYQPRKVMAQEGLEELANSMRTQGVIQPIIVRTIQNNHYEIIAGERRWRAAQMAGLDYIPAIVRDISDNAAMAMALIENIQRRDLSAIEEAEALQRLIDEFEMTHQTVADAVGKSRTNVTNLLRLLKLNPDVRGLLEKGHLEMGHARALLTLTPEQQSEIARIIVARALSVREAETLIRKMGNNSKSTVTSNNKIVLHTLQDRLMQKLGVKVSIVQNAKGSGKLMMKYNNESELENILEHIS